MSPSVAPGHLSSPSGSWLDTRPVPDANGNASKSPAPSVAGERADVAGWYYYLTPAAARRLPRYKYAGEDASPLFRHVLSPFAGRLVDRFVPAWAAPNAITLLGLSLMAASYGVVWHWCPGLYEANTDVGPVAAAYVPPESWFRAGPSPRPPGSYAVPGWIFALNSAALLAYQTLDNMDGIQARKTGSSSPLGLLFDHGCDAMNLMLGSANWMAAMAMVPGDVGDLTGRPDHDNVQGRSLVAALFGGDAVLAALLVLGPMLAFYTATWEHYHTGYLYLPPFNGPSEGLLMGATLSFLSFLWGPMYWQGTTAADGAIDRLLSFGDGRGAAYPYLASLRGRLRNMDVIVVLSLLCLAREVITKVVALVRARGLQPLWTLVPNLLLAFFGLAMVRADPTILLRRPRVMLHLINGLFTEQATQLLLCHVVEEPCRLRERWCLFPPVLLALYQCIAPAPIALAAVDTLLLTYTALLWVYVAFKIRVQLYEICDVLGIWCFDIVTPPRPKGAKSGGGASTAEGTAKKTD